jgi:hypothetical protein
MLFNSLQQIVDVDGNDLMGIGFDNECNRLTGITLADIEIMRRFFDRIKHIQKDSNQVAEFQKGNQMRRTGPRNTKYKIKLRAMKREVI